MTNSQKVLNFLTSIAPRAATNSEIVARTGVKPHQQVFQITQNLSNRGLIEARKRDGGWEFWVGQAHDADRSKEKLENFFSMPVFGEPDCMTPSGFEEIGRTRMQQEFGCALTERMLPGVHKRFDFVSDDGRIVGDAKYFSMVGGERYPPAKMSVISEHVWLLENVRAHSRFLLFGNDKRVPIRWLESFSNLNRCVEFYFLSVNGDLEVLFATRGARDN